MTKGVGLSRGLGPVAARLKLAVDEGIAELMTQLAGSERRRGHWRGAPANSE